VAAPASAPGQHFSAILGAHPFAEAVLTATLLLFWLKCSFWHLSAKNNKISLLQYISECYFGQYSWAFHQVSWVLFFKLGYPHSINSLCTKTQYLGVFIIVLMWYYE
jgi:hypothetical protein